MRSFRGKSGSWTERTGTRVICSWSTAGLLLFAGVPSAVSGEPPGRTLILGDASGSIRGFAVASSAQLRSVYQLTRRAVAQYPMELRAVRRRAGPDGKPESVLEPMPQNRFEPFGAAEFYWGESPLAEVVLRTTEDPRNGVVILVTDGMESEGYAANLRAALITRIEQGWGAWLLMIRLPFDGPYFTEQHIDDQHFGRVREAVRHANPRWSVERPRGRADPQCVLAGNCHYSFRGLRPLLILIVSREIDRGRAIAQQLAADLAKEPLPEPKVRTAELAPLYQRGLKVAHYPMLGESSLGLVVDSRDLLSPTVEWFSSEGPLVRKFAVALAWQHPVAPFEQLYNETAQYSETQKRPGWIREITAAFDSVSSSGSAGRIDIGLNAKKPGLIGRWLELDADYKQPLILRVATTLQASSEARWWDEWSADTSWETPHRLFRLRDLVRSASEAAATRKKAEPIILQIRLTFGS